MKLCLNNAKKVCVDFKCDHTSSSSRTYTVLARIYKLPKMSGFWPCFPVTILNHYTCICTALTVLCRSHLLACHNWIGRLCTMHAHYWSNYFPVIINRKTKQKHFALDILGNLEILTRTCNGNFKKTYFFILFLCIYYWSMFCTVARIFPSNNTTRLIICILYMHVRCLYSLFSCCKYCIFNVLTPC